MTSSQRIYSSLGHKTGARIFRLNRNNHGVFVDNVFQGHQGQLGSHVVKVFVHYTILHCLKTILGQLLIYWCKWHKTIITLMDTQGHQCVGHILFAHICLIPFSLWETRGISHPICASMVRVTLHSVKLSGSVKAYSQRTRKQNKFLLKG